MRSLSMLTLCALLLLTASAGAAPRTMISDYTGLDCTTNAPAPAFEKAGDVNGVDVFEDATPIHIFAGKAIGMSKPFPDTDDEFKRVWFRVARVQENGKPSKTSYWMQSFYINCGG